MEGIEKEGSGGDLKKVKVCDVDRPVPSNERNHYVQQTWTDAIKNRDYI